MDGAFGSFGSFFDLDLREVWRKWGVVGVECGPPYDEKVMNDAVCKILKHLSLGKLPTGGVGAPPGGGGGAGGTAGGGPTGSF